MDRDVYWGTTFSTFAMRVFSKVHLSACKYTNLFSLFSHIDLKTPSLACLPFLNFALFFLHSSSFLPSSLSSFVSLSFFCLSPSLISRARTRTYRKLHFLLSQVSHSEGNFFYFITLDLLFCFRHCFLLFFLRTLFLHPLSHFSVSSACSSSNDGLFY